MRRKGLSAQELTTIRNSQEIAYGAIALQFQDPADKLIGKPTIESVLVQQAQGAAELTSDLIAQLSNLPPLPGFYPSVTSNTPAPVPPPATTRRFFMAIGGQSGVTAVSTISYSSDSSNWFSARTGGFTSASGGGRNVAYGNDVWAATGYATIENTIQRSTDGSNWSSTNVSGGNTYSTSYGKGIAYGGGLFVQGGEYQRSDNFRQVVRWSTDALAWTPGTTPNGAPNVYHLFFINALAYNGSYWLGAGDGSTRASTIIRSTDGKSWVGSGSNLNIGPYTDVIWDGSRWVVSGQSQGGTAGNCWQYSTDAQTWQMSATGRFSGQVATGLAYNGKGTYVTTGYALTTGGSNSTIMYSTDVANWVAIPPTTTAFQGTLTAPNGTAYAGHGVTYDSSNDVFIATGVGTTSANSILRSTDGISWATSISGTAPFTTAYNMDVANVPI